MSSSTPVPSCSLGRPLAARFPFSAVHNIKRADTIKKHRRFPPEAAVFSSLLLFGEQLAERLAGFNRLVVGRFAADDALTDELAARGLDVVFPIAHPFAVAPAVGAEQTHGRP